MRPAPRGACRSRPPRHPRPSRQPAHRPRGHPHRSVPEPTGQVARNELSLVKLKERIEGRAPRVAADAEAVDAEEPVAVSPNEAVEDLLDVIRNPEVLGSIGTVDRTNLAKYLTIAKLRLENAIAVVRTGDSDR